MGKSVKDGKWQKQGLTLENLKTIKEMEKVNLFGITENIIMENGSITRNKEVVCGNQPRGMYISVVG